MRSRGDPLSPQITALEYRFHHALSWVTLPQRRRPWTWLPLTFLCLADSQRVCDAKAPLLRHVNPTEYPAECDSSCGTDLLATYVASTIVATRASRDHGARSVASCAASTPHVEIATSANAKETNLSNRRVTHS